MAARLYAPQGAEMAYEWTGPATRGWSWVSSTSHHRYQTMNLHLYLIHGTARTKFGNKAIAGLCASAVTRECLKLGSARFRGCWSTTTSFPVLPWFTDMWSQCPPYPQNSRMNKSRDMRILADMHRPWSWLYSEVFCSSFNKRLCFKLGKWTRARGCGFYCQEGRYITHALESKGNELGYGLIAPEGACKVTGGLLCT